MGAGGVMNGQYDYEWAKHIYCDIHFQWTLANQCFLKL